MSAAPGIERSDYDERQGWLPGVEPHYLGWPPPARLAPLVRWAGGKRWILPLVGAGIHRYLCNTGGRFCEPFAGGAAVAAWLGWPRTMLGDACLPLASLYAEVIVNGDKVAEARDALAARGNDEATYYAIRRERPTTRVDFAAWCLYLNRRSFNGLWRENKRGEFNVPFAHLEHPADPSREHLAAWAERARAWVVHHGDFAPLIEQLGAGDVLFADPPYADGTRGGFSGYVQGGWTADDRARLAEIVGRAAARGALVVVTDGASEAARADYSAAGLMVLQVKSRHSVGAKGGAPRAGEGMARGQRPGGARVICRACAKCRRVFAGVGRRKCCPGCRDKQARATAALAAERLEQDLCVKCEAPIEEDRRGRTHCAGCATLNRDYCRRAA